jgi:mono/diheme cytochrome c family protein
VCMRGVFTVFDLDTEIGDPVLRQRLKQSIFATPGTYEATIRFANAASTFNPDYEPDVRAVSFALKLPNGKRHDFSFNNATTFPINDAHEFAILMRLKEAGSKWKSLMALTTLNFSEIMSLGKMNGAAKKQFKNSVQPFQRFRYWSGVPFRHGPDEAVKYSLTSRTDNPAPPLEHDRNMLRDELVRHVETDKRMSEFDFGVQFLDSDDMRDGARKRDDIYWVENARLEWPEAQAPFHTIARLTLVPNSVLSDAEARAFSIDVSENSTAETHPLGSVNRARWFGESASRNARLGLPAAKAAVDHTALADIRDGAPLPAPAIQRRKPVGSVTVGSLGRYAAVLAFGLILATAAFTIGTMTVVQTHYGQLPEKKISDVIYRNRGWGDGLNAPLRQTFYYTPQGAGLEDVRYSWFVNLEMPWGTQRIADASIMQRYGFLVDQPTERNPDRLPVGFTRHFDSQLNEEMLDITCATCHTGQIEFTKNGQTRAMRIDGGQANHAFTDANVGEFLITLTTSMYATALDPVKFDRFARRVLDGAYPQGTSVLRSQLLHVANTLGGIGLYEKIHRLSPTQEGYGRTDALARISNTVFGQNLGVDKNYAVGNAPVSFPSLWNIWKFDWVQYNASVSQPMARNLGESMGVGAKYTLVDRYGKPLPFVERFRATANIEGLNTIEHTLRKLAPPEWPEDLLGSVNHARADSGRKLFEENCESCHGPHIAPEGLKKRNSPGKGPNDPEWLITTLCASDVGTDSMTAANFTRARVDITRTGMTAQQLRDVARGTMEKWIPRESTWVASEITRLASVKDSAAQRDTLKYYLASLRSSSEHSLSQIDPANMQMGAALSYLGTMIRENAYKDARYTKEQQDTLDGYGALDMPQIMRGYKSRPLAGVWATPPFLHNGSVPTVFDLLGPVDKRPAKFQVGSREYDPKKLGLSQDVKGYWTFDTSKPGNGNRGHGFDDSYKKNPHNPPPGVIGRALSEQERYAIIEYLKIRDDDVDGPKQPHIPHTCSEAW